MPPTHPMLDAGSTDRGHRSQVTDELAIAIGIAIAIDRVGQTFPMLDARCDVIPTE